jgi:Homoserine kinase
MSLVSTVTVTVPATTANLGPGFDCIGAALTLYNQFKFTRLDLATERLVEATPDHCPLITVSGVEQERVITDDSNLVYQSFVKLYQQLGQAPPPVNIEIGVGCATSEGIGGVRQRRLSGD